MPIQEALRLAEEAGVDLVKIAPTAKPPVCKIVDYGKYKYDQLRKAKEAKKKQKIVKAEMDRMTAGVYVAPPSGLPHTEPTDYTTVPTKSLEWLVDQILQWECLCCQREGKEQKKCPFRERLESLYLFELPDIKKGECPFMTMERYTR